MGVDPFAEALCCFEPLNRTVTEATVTARQLQVLTLVAQGKTTAAIAAASVSASAPWRPIACA